MKRTLKADPQTNQGRSLFQSLSLEFKHCTEGELGDHANISSQPTAFYLERLSLSVMNQFQGDIQSVLNHHVSLEAMPHRSCWVSDVQGDLMCNGVSEMTSVLLSAPVIKIYQLELDMVSKATTWNYPKTLTLLSLDTELLVYDLVGRIFYNGFHYTCRFGGEVEMEERCPIFHYDGMIHNGRSIFLPDATLDSHLAGTDSELIGLTEGYHTFSAVYLL